VDLSRELRQAMLDLRDSKFLIAFQRGLDLGNELIFQDAEGQALDRNVVTRVFKGCLSRAGLREIRFHDLRHTFGSQLIQNGASLVYVRDQMGHSSIRVTADLYGHLIPSANVNAVDRLDAQTTPQESATQAQPRPRCRARKSRQLVEKTGGPGGVRTLDLMTARLTREG